MDSHHPFKITSVDDIWDIYFTSIQTQMAITGHRSEQWHRIFRSHFYRVSGLMARLFVNLANNANKKEMSLEEFARLLSTFAAEIESAEIKWVQRREAERAEDSCQKAPTIRRRATPRQWLADLWRR